MKLYTGSKPKTTISEFLQSRVNKEKQMKIVFFVLFQAQFY
jgi:hypothetical protein